MRAPRTARRAPSSAQRRSDGSCAIGTYQRLPARPGWYSSSETVLGELQDRWLPRVEIPDLQLIRASGQREHPVDGWAAAQENQPAAGASRPVASVDDRSHSAAIDKPEVSEVQHDQPCLQL